MIYLKKSLRQKVAGPSGAGIEIKVKDTEVDWGDCFSSNDLGDSKFYSLKIAEDLHFRIAFFSPSWIAKRYKTKNWIYKKLTRDGTNLTLTVEEIYAEVKFHNILSRL